MTKMIEQKAQYVFDANTEVKPFEGWLSIFNFILTLVGIIKRKIWTFKIANMTDGQILDAYYVLTKRGESDDYIISKAVIRSTDE